jgi:hypothetical protein
MAKISKISIVLLISMISAVTAGAQTYAGKGTCYYSYNSELATAKESAIYYAAIDALGSSGNWYVEDVNGIRIYNPSRITSNKIYFLYDIHNHTSEYLSQESVFDKVIITGEPHYSYGTTCYSRFVTAKADFIMSGKKNKTASVTRSKMRSYIGVGSVGYCWNLYPEKANILNWYNKINNNGIYATLGRFKFGTKFFAVTMDLVSYDQNSSFWTTYTNTGNPYGEYSLDSNNITNGDYNVKLEQLSFVKLGWQYDFNLFKRNYRHFSPYKFVLSPFINVSPIELTFVKMPFPYYKEINHRFIKCNTGELSTFFNCFKDFTAGLKISSSLYELTIGYNWRYGERDFIQNYGNGDFGPASKLSSKGLNMEHGYIFVKFGICFDWNTRNFKDL